MRWFVMLLVSVLMVLSFSQGVRAANELIGFYADPNADANGTPYFMVVNAADGNMLYLKDDVNYVFARWDAVIPDANFRITPNANRHGIGVYFADLPATTPACRYYSMVVTSKDSNEIIRYTSPMQYWNGSSKQFIVDVNGRVDVATVLDVDANTAIQNNVLKANTKSAGTPGSAYKSITENKTTN